MTVVNRRGFLAGAGVAMVAAAGCSRPSAPDVSASPVPADTVLTRLGGEAPGFGIMLPRRFETPNLALVITRWGTVSSLGRDATSGLSGIGSGPITAPAGHELAVLGMVISDASYAAQPDVALVIDAHSYPLRLPTSRARDWDAIGDVSDELIYVAAVPQGRPVALTITDAGQAATFDVRAGVPASDAGTAAVAVLRDTKPTLVAPGWGLWHCNGTIDSDAHPAQGAFVSIGLNPRGLRLVPWTPDLGWAKAGRAWLRLRLELEGHADAGAAGRVTLGDVFQPYVAGAGIRPVTDRTVEAQDLPEPGRPRQRIELCYDVPADLDWFPFAVDTRLTVVDPATGRAPASFRQGGSRSVYTLSMA